MNQEKEEREEKRVVNGANVFCGLIYSWSNTLGYMYSSINKY